MLVKSWISVCSFFDTFFKNPLKILSKCCQDVVSPKQTTSGQMTTAIAIEDVRREVRILSSLTGHSNLVQFYDAFEDEENVYVVME